MATESKMQTAVMAETRTATGSGAAGRLRRTGKLPANVFNHKCKAMSIEINTHDFEQLLRHHVSENVVLDLSVDGKKAKKVLLMDIQRHSVSGDLLHVDFMEISMKEKLTIMVPITLKGEPEGVNRGGTLDHVLRELEVECLPVDVPEEIDVDVSALKIGDTILAGDVTLDAKLTLLTDPEVAIAGVLAPRKEEEVEGGEAAEGEEGPQEPELVGSKEEEESEES